MSPLFSPLTLRGLILRNRAVLSPMCQYQALNGETVPWHLQHHARFASGGLALAFVEATGVVPEGRITHGCTGLWHDGQIAGMKAIVELYHSTGTACGIQIGHAGRRASCERPFDGAAPIQRRDGPEARWQTVAPSAIAERAGAPVPHEMTAAEIAALIETFRTAALRALSAGFDVVEIHGAHGYLLHSFFSPLTNRRSDGYGGTRERRMAVPLAVAEAVRAVWPENKPLFYRTSVIDGIEGGLTVEDSVALASTLKQRGIDVIDCSSLGMAGSGSLSALKITPGFQVPYAAALRREAGIATMAVGAIIDPAQAETILREGSADLIALGRQMMAEPHWLYRAALELGHPEPFSILPRPYAFYLERRAKALDLSGHNSRH